MKYRVECSIQMIEGLKQMDRHSASIVLAWVRRYLEGCTDPCSGGAWVPGGGCERWRYKVGPYSILAEIQMESRCILLLWVGNSDAKDSIG